MITNYSSFHEYQSATNPLYKTPTFEDVVAKERSFGHHYDEEKNCFYGFYGQFHEKPGSRFDISWQRISDEYDAMYKDFSIYGTE